MKIRIGKYLKRSDGRKINIEIEKFDTYSLDHTLALIILPALLQLKDTKHGVPADFADAGGADYDMQDSFDFYKESHDWAFEQKCKEWDNILDKMIWSFQQIALENPEELYHHGEIDYDWVKTDKTFFNPVTQKVEPTYQLVNKNSEHWYDAAGHRLHQDRIEEGLELFGKYFTTLWD